MARIVFMGVLLTALVVGIAGARAGATTAAGTAQAAPESPDVKIDNFTFGPSDVTVKAGSTITWTNRDDIPHTVVSTDKVFKSKVLDTDDHFSYTFASPGTFTYFCSIHPKMTGRIVVK
jgi:plastocyanin